MKLDDEAYAYAEKTDLPVIKLVALAERAANQKIREGFNVDIHFKHTCHKCRHRMMFELPNMVYEEVECGNCGHKEPFIKGGFSMIYKFNDPQTSYKNPEVTKIGKTGDSSEVGVRRSIRRGAFFAGTFDATTGEETK